MSTSVIRQKAGHRQELDPRLGQSARAVSVLARDRYRSACAEPFRPEIHLRFVWLGVHYGRHLRAEIRDETASHVATLNLEQDTVLESEKPLQI